ncbi:MAG: hypothetical protein GYA36_18385, partial [Veillonellaceae bacterium]|nr:hypothetical protein [Veillonellaceae bacterium]
MYTPEKNDIDITKLFQWGKEASIFTNGVESLKYFVRLVGDAELNRARVYSIRESSRLRKLLRTAGTDEREAFIGDINFMEKDNLIEYIILTKTKEFVQTAYETVNVPFPKEPKANAKLEVLEKYQAEIDDYPNKVSKEATKLVEKQIADFRKLLQEKTIE